MPKISIIVPIYNVEKYLPRCIDSILAQTFTDFELILVDDGSPDNCPQICDEYAKKDNRIKVIHKENGGISSARNIGLDISKGDYISFVDSDDIIYFKYFEFLAQNVQDQDVDIVYCEYKKFTECYNFEEICDYDIETETLSENNIFLNPPFSFYVVWNKLIRHELIYDLRFDTNIKNAEDSLFAFELLKRSRKVVYVKAPLYGYFIRSNGAVATIDLEGKKQCLFVWDKIYSYIKERKNSVAKKHVKKRLDYYYICLFYALKRDDKEYLRCKKYLKRNAFNLLCSDLLTLKDKIVLILKLYHLGGIYECWNRYINRK